MESIKSVKIYLNNADEVWKFVNIIRKFSGDYDLAAGSYTVDAKSILGVCALGTKKPLELKLVDPRGEEKKPSHRAGPVPDPGMNVCRSPLLTERFIPVKRLEILFLPGRDYNEDS